MGIFSLNLSEIFFSLLVKGNSIEFPYLAIRYKYFSIKIFLLYARGRNDERIDRGKRDSPPSYFFRPRNRRMGGLWFLHENFTVSSTVKETSRKLRERLFPTLVPQPPAETIIISAIRGAPTAHARCRVTL